MSYYSDSCNHHDYEWIQMVLGASIYLTSPLYPNRYPNNQYCAWRIQLINGTGNFVLTVFNLYLSSSTNDFLKIGMGMDISENTTIAVLDSYYTFPNSIIVEDDWMWVYFSSDYSTSQTGFFIQVQTTLNEAGKETNYRSHKKSVCYIEQNTSVCHDSMYA